MCSPVFFGADTPVCPYGDRGHIYGSSGKWVHLVLKKVDNQVHLLVKEKNNFYQGGEASCPQVFYIMLSDFMAMIM